MHRHQRTALSSMESTDDPTENESTPRRYSAPRTRLLEQRGKPINRESMREHEFFRDCNPRLMDLLLDVITVNVFMPGFDIMKEGDEGDCMYFMYRGEVEVLVGPTEKRVAVLKDGSIFGEMALLGNGKRAATIRAMEVCDCRVITAQSFNFCLKRFPKEKRYFEHVVKHRQAEIDKTKAPAPPSTPSTALQKFRRASKAISVCSRMGEASTAPASRTTTNSDDIMAHHDKASSRSPSAPSAVARHRQRPSSLEKQPGGGRQASRGRPSAESDVSNHGLSEMLSPGIGQRPCSRRPDAMCSPYTPASGDKRSTSRRRVSETTFNAVSRACNEMFSPHQQAGNGQRSSSRRRASDATFEAFSRMGNEMFSPYREAGNRKRSTSGRRVLDFTSEVVDQAISEVISPYRQAGSGIRSSSRRRSSEAPCEGSNRISNELASPFANLAGDRRPSAVRRDEIVHRMLSLPTPTRAPALNSDLLYMGLAGEL
mmetsp:Transcript_163973/g.290218  ORF Transcript_163973/g.290218 Transcript_163973/m.290218 type:complete len:485 (+) Transcript_163973:2-1456(+)